MSECRNVDQQGTGWKELTKLTFDIVESSDFLGKGTLESVGAFVELFVSVSAFSPRGQG